ncbi:MAG: DegT/DnrJ/EryC1/StrS family aminotransferase [Candidatus Omnitrophica bacterium]|nr:DegT/DnrJ/EryC1/StrS family aminotransferase [Candidatus Omnitrophota bacterium]
MIPHSKPSINIREINALNSVLRSGLIAEGSLTAKFERQLADFVGVRFATAVNSGTSGLHLALLALKIKQGDEVIIPSYVCTAVLNAVNYTGATVKIVDIDPDSFNICPIAVKEALTKKTKAIIVPHMFGLAADLKELLEFGVPVIEDCAMAVGATYNGQKLGSFGAISVFSFYATKMLTTAEGGMILANNKKIAAFVRDLKDYDNKPDYRLRFNYKMNDLSAAIGLEQLKKIPDFISRRQRIARMYNKSLVDSGLVLPLGGNIKEHVYFRYAIRLRKSANILIAKLQEAGIEAKKPVFRPLHQYLRLKSADFPSTNEVFKSTVSLPIYPELSSKNAKYIISKTLKALAD